MAGLAKQTVVLTAARFANYGLTLISPVILVRLLTTEQFGQYREFILYAQVLQLGAAFSLAESLLYFIPKYAGSTWRVVSQTNLLVLYCSAALMLVVAVGDLLSHGAIVGQNLLPLLAYVVLFVNLDFWEYYFLATHRPIYVFAYTSGRLTARLLAVILMAYLTHDVHYIIWSLVALEALRLGGSAIALGTVDRRAGNLRVPHLWSEQLRFCVPTGLGVILFMTNRNLGAFYVDKMLGHVSLANYTIGTYADYIYLAVGNSIAAVVLPEMVRRDRQSRDDAVQLWRKTTVVNTMLLLPAAIVLARFAGPIITTAFKAEYRPAVPVLQIHMLFLVRACVDFAPALRAINRTRPLVYSNIAALCANALILSLVMPWAGLRGAVTALVMSSYVEAAVLGWWTSKLYGMPLRRLVPLAGMGKVLVATVAGTVTLLLPVWGNVNLPGVIVATCCYYAVVIAVMGLLKVDEARILWGRLRNFGVLLRANA